MTSEALRRGDISENNVKESLLKARGDIFIASSYLSITPRELDRYIRTSDELQLFTGSIESVKQNAEYDKLSNEQFKRQLDNKTKSFKLDALDVIYDIATMDQGSIGEIPMTAAMYEVKLKAAIKLRGNDDEKSVNNDHLNILTELNNQYLQTAPRIKSIRAIQVEFEKE